MSDMNNTYDPLKIKKIEDRLNFLETMMITTTRRLSEIIEDINKIDRSLNTYVQSNVVTKSEIDNIYVTQTELISKVDGFKIRLKDQELRQKVISSAMNNCSCDIERIQSDIKEIDGRVFDLENCCCQCPEKEEKDDCADDEELQKEVECLNMLATTIKLLSEKHSKNAGSMYRDQINRLLKEFNDYVPSRILDYFVKLTNRIEGE